MSRAGKPAGADGAGGFTLLELLVVLTIVAGILALVPLISERSASNAQLYAAARVVAADLRWLRQAAIRERHETSLEVDAPHGRYMRSGDTAYRSLPDGIGIEHRPVAAIAPDKDRAAILFYPDGTSSGGEVALHTATQALHIRVSWPFGRIAMDRRRE